MTYNSNNKISWHWFKVVSIATPCKFLGGIRCITGHKRIDLEEAVRRLECERVIFQLKIHISRLVWGRLRALMSSNLRFATP